MTRNKSGFCGRCLFLEVTAIANLRSGREKELGDMQGDLAH